MGAIVGVGRNFCVGFGDGVGAAEGGREFANKVVLPKLTELIAKSSLRFALAILTRDLSTGKKH